MADNLLRVRFHPADSGVDRMNLDKLWLQAKAKRDSAAARHGNQSKVTRAYERDLAEITARIIRRDMRKTGNKRKAA
ncbi:MAG: hypothetical protein KDI55_25825 [Anaerolineae bacterium]|nr:hypothetical protein [Anaerolineae bacterium]